MDAWIKRHVSRPFFWIGWILYFAIRIDRSSSRLLPDFVSGFLPDFLCLPLMLWVILLLIRLIKKDKELMLTPAMIIVAVVAFSVLFEWVLPQRNSIYTSDVWDVVAYSFGGIAYYFIQKRSA